MKKPEFQFETASLRARRRPAAHSELADDARAESFDLLDRAGETCGELHLGLTRQFGRAPANEHSGLEFAARAWLIARGQRRLDLQLDGAPARVEAIDVAKLSDPPPASPPRRVITLAPSNAELVHALGAFGRVVACEDSSDFPPAVDELERLGPDLGPNLERVAELAPDLVVSSLTVPGMERIVTGLRARSLPQLVCAPRTLDDVVADLHRAAAALHCPDAGLRAVEAFERERGELLAQRVEPPVRVYLEWWPRPMFTPGADCYSNELIALAGGRNVFAERPGSSLEIGAEELMEAAPEICFVSWCGVAVDKLDPQRVVGRPGLERLAAAQRGRVYPLDEAFAGRPGPRVLEAARIMAGQIRKLREP